MRFLLRRPLFVLTFAVAPAAACSSSPSEPPLTDATSLHCPTPGNLPFRLTSSGFQNTTSKAIAADNVRAKDQASDTIGNPGGPVASVYLDDSQQPAAGPIDYHGLKGRSPVDNGTSETPLAGENVSLWFHDTTQMAWRSVGRGQTDSNGEYDLPATNLVAPDGQPVYAMLEADGSCATHYDYLYPPGEKVVVTDIDGTLTLSNSEVLFQLTMADYVPKLMPAADKLVQAWAAKGYPIIYLTARPHNERAETREWFDVESFPTGPLITENGGKTADAYKTLWLQRMIQDFGWNVVAAYGNEDTDITAYANAGIPAAQTFIVGPLAGTRGTIPIANMDFAQHIASFVAAQPMNQ
ncbi:MAG TPA: HAD family acid phosphatase [Kofleriaceae bacterium]|jgi:hypothetical protein|nr:HAD family acid phosphatase [Kofleriaceae bacterium]